MTDSIPPNDDPFAEFEDWLVDGPAGEWPEPWFHGSLSKEQQRVVASNAALLTHKDRDVWRTKVGRFENALAALGSSDAIKARRARFKIRFDHHVFRGGPQNFNGFVFPCSVAFASTEFGDEDVVFSNAEFKGEFCRFENCDFGQGHVKFYNSMFRDCHFFMGFSRFGDGDLSFNGASFSGKGVSLQVLWFGTGSIRFSSPTFGDRHMGATPAILGDSEVSLFQLKMPDADLHLSDLVLKGNLFCHHNEFRRCYVYRTLFSGLASFRDTSSSFIPDFRNAEFDRPPEVARMTVPAPVMSRRWPSLRSKDKEDVLKLRKLKAMAIAANDHEKDGEFFAYEMMAKRGVEHTTFWQLLFNTIYWKVSFYGQSYLRPLGWLSASFATFATIYSLMATPPLAGWNSLGFGITYSFKNSLPFLGTLTRSVPSPEGHVSWFALQLDAIKSAQPGPDWFTVLGTGQAMLSLFFFFFLLLGLRNKFRLK